MSGHKQGRQTEIQRCVQELKGGVDAAATLRHKKSFSAVPPLGVLKLLVSLCASKLCKTKQFVLISTFCSKAFNTESSGRSVRRTLSGVHPWSTRRKHSDAEGVHNAVVHYWIRCLWDGSSGVHLWRLVLRGDDIIYSFGEVTAVDDSRRLLKTKHTTKLAAESGDGDQQQEAVILNHAVRHVSKEQMVICNGTRI